MVNIGKIAFWAKKSPEKGVTPGKGENRRNMKSHWSADYTTI